VNAQRGFTIFSPIEGSAAEADALHRLLVELGDADASGEGTGLGLPAFGDLHFASMSVVPLSSGVWHLVFEGNVDGDPDTFLRQLVTTSAPVLHTIYERCADFPAPGRRSTDAVLAYLARHDIGSGSFYVGLPGFSVAKTRQERDLRAAIEEIVDDPDSGVLDGAAAEVRAAIARVVLDQPDMRWAETPGPRPFLVRRGRVLVAAVGALVGLRVVRILAQAFGRRNPARRRARRSLLALLGLGGVVAALLRREERGDDRRDAEHPERQPDWQAAYDAWNTHLGRVRALEDRQVQNHMISVVAIKPGPFRAVALRVVLSAIHAVAILWENRGQLGGISSIHFARWVIAPGGKDLVFLSNFDGSWESYLDEFIDRASFGLTAVWSNSDDVVGFPSTRWLVTRGARDEARFKAFARSSMWPSSLWYSAYPSLTVANMIDNAAIRDDLCRTLDAADDETWRRRL
jgi:hypothetical protein